MLEFDRERCRTLEALHLRPEFAAFEEGLATQIAALDSFRHRNFTRIRGLSGAPGRLVMLSDHVPGMRLSEILTTAAERQTIFDAASALYLTKRLLATMSTYAAATGYTHGALAPERIIVTRRGRVVVAEHALVPALQHLRYSSARWWQEFRIAWPISRADPVFDERTDVAQIALLALALLHGRTLGADDGPGTLETLLAAAPFRTVLDITGPLPGNLQGWFTRALSVPSSRSFDSLADARQAFELILVEEFHAGVTRTSLTRLLERLGELDDRNEDFSSAVSDVAAAAPALTPHGPPVPPSNRPPRAAPPVDPAATADEPALPVEPIAVPVRQPPTALPPPAATPQLKPLAALPSPKAHAASLPAPYAHPASADDEEGRGADSPARPRRWSRVAALFTLCAILAGASLTGQWERLGDRVRATIATAEARIDPEPELATGQLRLDSTPSGAHVTLNGDPVGVTPVTVDTLPPGSYVVRFASPSGAIERTVEVAAGQTATLSEAIYAGWVAFFAPVQLTILQNGHPVGSTEDGRIMVPPGRHTFELVGERYGFRQTVTLQVDPGEVVARTIDPPPGRLSVRAEPWADVSIDGTPVGRTPLDDISIAIGTRSVLFSHPEHGEKRAVLTVVTDQPHDLHMDMTR